MAITHTHNKFDSCDGTNKISYACWRDDAQQPKKILQIAHGMAEHIARYDAFARFMASAGYVVYGSDHLGHGQSVKSDDDLGYIGGKRGGELMAKDLNTLTHIAKTENLGLPLILMGHSMGSFIVRLYAAQYGKDIDGLIVMGTSGPNPAAGAGGALAGFLSLFKGKRHRSKFIDNMAFGGYNKQYAEPKTSFDWLSTDEAEVQKYIDDPQSGYLFTLWGFQSLFSALAEVSKKDWAEKLPKDLPVLLISGADDPVGDMGKGVSIVYDRLQLAGLSDVSIILYEGMRHEILNEKDKDRVYADILAWCDAVK